MPHYTNLDLRHTICPSCDLAVVPMSETVRLLALESFDHAKIALHRLKDRVVVIAAYAKKFLVRIGRGYRSLLKFSKKHRGTTDKLYATLSAAATTTVRSVSAFMKQAREQMRSHKNSESGFNSDVEERTVRDSSKIGFHASSITSEMEEEICDDNLYSSSSELVAEHQHPRAVYKKQQSNGEKELEGRTYDNFKQISPTIEQVKLSPPSTQK